jgi:hypothetical protein
MPYAPETKRSSPTGTSKAAQVDELADLFGFSGLHQLVPVIEGVMGRPGSRGRRPGHTLNELLASVAAARVTTSQASALAMLGRPEVRERCRAGFERASGGLQLANRPPTAEQIQYFRRVLLDLAGVDYLAGLQLRHQRLAYGQSRKLGNFPFGIAPDLSKPDERHAIYGDGTIPKPFTDVRIVTDPRNPDLSYAIGSRAKSVDAARVQKGFSHTEEDGKDARGLNMVAIHTWTAAGRVVLATGVAERAEQWAAMDLIDSLMAIISEVEDRQNPGARHDPERFQPGVHTLIYDRAITGWAVGYLMDRHGIQVLGKPVGDKHLDDPDAASPDRELEARARRLGAEYDLDRIKDSQQRKVLNTLLRRDVLADLVRYHDKLPLGISVYPKEKTKGIGRDLEHVRSYAALLPPATHHTLDGTCSRDIALDDGSLFLVEPDPEEGHWVKTALLECDNATRSRGTDGSWVRTSRYRVPCPHGEFEHTHKWTPSDPRRQPPAKIGERTTPPPKDPIGWRLRPLSRPDDLRDWYNDGIPMHEIEPEKRHFTRASSRRNDSESYNSWFQASLPHRGRAASLTRRGQELDFLLAAVLNNSMTWANHNRLTS